MSETARRELLLAEATNRTAAVIAYQAALIASLFALSVGLVALVEALAGRSPENLLSFMLSSPGITTVVFVFVVALGLDVLMGRAFRSLIILAPAMILLAFLSRQKQTYLSDPLYPSDLLFARQIKELLPVMISAKPWLAIGMGLAGIATLALLFYCAFFAWKRFPVLSSRARLFRLVLALPFLVGFTPMMKYTDHSWLRDRLSIVPIMWDQAENYRHNGFLIAFAFNLPMSHVSPPHGYSDKAIANIQVDPTAFAVSSKPSPDIIMIMSESLWDPTRLSNVRLDSDPMPTIRQNQAGNIFSPEFGGMTANVEFEALTGFSNAFLPYGSIPYQQYIRGRQPSLATFFRQKGYTSVAVHPFEGWFWNRNNVYQHLGFDKFLSQENLPALEKRGMFASDTALMNEIMRIGDEAEQPLFLFTVTLQGHGPYEANRYAHNRIAVDGPLSEAAAQQLATYSEGVREADDSLEQLMDWAKNRRRETIIVLFGDHLPPMGQVFMETGYMQEAVATRRASLETMLSEHETPLLVWSSKTGPKKDLGTISPALLSHHVVEAAGFSDPFYTGFLGDVAKQFSVIDRYMLVDADSRPVPGWNDGGKKAPDLLKDYRLLQYDMMFGKQHARERFFPALDDLAPMPETPVADVPHVPSMPG